MSRCDLYLENYQSQYVGGQTIIGHVLCTFTSDKEVNSIFVKIKGEATTQWTESESHYDSSQKKNVTRTVHYHGSEVFLSQQIDLATNRGNSLTIPEGTHRYPFSFTLPSDLPSSFEGGTGKVEYKIKAVVERSFFKFNYDAESVINMYTPMDLNIDATLREPTTINKDKSVSCCCRGNGNITTQVNIPYKGFAIGQSVPLHINVENLSRVSIEAVKVKVKREFTFHSQTPRHHKRHSTSDIFIEQYTGIGAHGENIYDKTILLSNESACVNLSYSTLITVNYTLEVKFVLPMPHRNMTVHIPISVGNIPIRNIQQSFSSEQSQPPAYVPPNTVNAPYGFTELQPPFNPAMAVPPLPPSYGSVGNSVGTVNIGFPQPSLLPNAPNDEASAPPSSSWQNPNFCYSGNQDLPPTYNQAVQFEKALEEKQPMGSKY